MLKRIALALLIAAPLLAEQKTPPPPAPAQPVQWPPMTEKKLENGLTVVIVPLHNAPKVTAELSFLAGRGTGHRESPGVAQLAARVLSEGTKTRSSLRIKEELREIGGELNVVTDADATTVTASSLSELAPRLFDIVADVVRQPAYPAKEVDLAKTNFAQEIESNRADPDFLAEEQIDRALFGASAYGFTVPDPKAVAKVTRESLVAFAAAHYLPNNATLIVVGDIDPAKTLDEVRAAFGSWPRAPLPPAETLTLPKREKRQVYFVDRPGSVQSTILFGAAAPARKSADYHALRTANILFGGAFTSRLSKNLREAKGFAYSPYSTVDLRRRGGKFVVVAPVRNEVTGAAILEILYELDRMRLAAPEKEELDAVKRFATGTMMLEMETQQSFATRIRTIYTYDLPRDFLQTFQEKTTATTADDIRKAAAKYFDTYRAAIVIVGDYAKVKEQVGVFGDVVLVK